MTIKINPNTALWSIGVLQPVSAEELAAYYQSVFVDAGVLPSADELHKYCLRASNAGLLIRVWRKPDLFSLSLLGNRFLSRTQRKSRDRARFFLLKDSRRARVRLSRETDETGLGGEPPSVTERSLLQGGEANKLRLRVPRGRTCWPRPSGQLNTGPAMASRDIYPTYFSFETPRQLAVGLQRSKSPPVLDAITLGLMLGVSPRIVQGIAWHADGHYRRFELRKRGGGRRPIDSPRVFLKVMQQFLVDYILPGLPISDCVHSFRVGASIHSNARQHCNAAYVGSIDIRDFFGSVTKGSVESLLTKNGLPGSAVKLISRLVTKDGSLPQGAPTSPLLSNAILYNFDEYVSMQCKRSKLTYSRYADDIVISGEKRELVRKMMVHSDEILRKDYGLQVNKDKTRLVSKNAQQRVTGIVINEKFLPPRTFRRKIRALFYYHSQKGEADIENIRRLFGYVCYLQSFDDLRDSAELAKYRNILAGLRVSKENH